VIVVDDSRQVLENTYASIEELDQVEGIGEVRAKAIKDGLKYYREQLLLDRRI
jgi:diadenylate cyclase